MKSLDFIYVVYKGVRNCSEVLELDNIHLCSFGLFTKKARSLGEKNHEGENLIGQNFSKTFRGLKD